MSSTNENTSSFSADQAVAAGSLLRSLTSRLHTLPQPEAEVLAHSLLVPAGLVNDICLLVEAANARAVATLPELRRHLAAAEQTLDGVPSPVRTLANRSSSPGTRGRGLFHPMASVAPE
ncbi:hypothetical protein [Streptomyces sp. NBC_01233]|uniref:hypothetical protein n=1 Tax=Streptomyces sp. NBC_01233 TaxID=2903787 RepID=UPI002E14BB88|nr:hypothetical protein OG332_37305 [Streptomyces sp. NBC_01233]